MVSMKGISQLLKKNNQLYFALIARELAKHGITLPQAFVIGEVSQNPKTIGEISKALDLSNSTVSGIVDRLERNQILMRERSAADRRVVHVSLGKDLGEIEKQYPILKEDYFARKFHSLSETLTEEELLQLYNSLQHIQAYLEILLEKE